MLYEIRREKRQNHPGHHKACLYLGLDRMADCKDGRIIVKTARPIPEVYLNGLLAEWEKILADEGPVR